MHLTVLSGRSSGVRLDLTAEPVTVGRDADCDLALTDSGISRHHARFQRRDDDAHVYDLDSTNGVFVNGRQTRHHVLEDGDHVRIGADIVLRFSARTQMSVEMSIRDSVTGVFNRRHFLAQLNRELAAVIQTHQPLSVVLCAVEGIADGGQADDDATFKSILARVAYFLSVHISEGDVVARYSDRMFSVLLRGSDRQTTLGFVNAVEASVNDSIFSVAKRPVAVTVRFGFSSLDEKDFCDSDDLIEEAETSLGRASPTTSP
jgi:diguanylate cyclase (GGDEF)-like protein